MDYKIKRVLLGISLLSIVFIGLLAFMTIKGLSNGSSWFSYVGWLTFFGSLLLTVLIIVIVNKLKKKEINIRNEKKITIVTISIIIVISCFSMKLSPFWSGKTSSFINQYEVMADSLINGHLYMDYDDIDPNLAKLNNPYDPVERKEKAVNFHWDHAYYNGHYYMYFGIVPAILLFVPFKLITGTSLTTYHATQLFTALYIIGLFLLIFKLKKKFFDKISYPMTLLLASTFSIISTWYICAIPSLYCTAISSAICMEIWSLYFFIKTVYFEENENKQILYAFIGAIFGALAFGCRPPVALANFVLIPLLIEYLKKKKIANALRPKLFLKLLIVILPYIIIGALLMYYNYARFGNVFEFGQSYQLTYADQHLFGNLFTNLDINKVLTYLYECFINIQGKYIGLVFQFPIFIFCFFMFNKNIKNNLKQNGLYYFLLITGIMVIVIVLFQSITAPWFLERYKSDFIWLLSIMAFIIIGTILNTYNDIKLDKYKKIIVFLCVFAIVSSVILFLVPDDSNFTSWYLRLILGKDF